MQFMVLAASLVGALVSSAAGCSNEEAAACPHISSLIRSKLTFLDASNIDAECRKYSQLFTCAERFIGDCDLKSRLSWQPIAMQINNICNQSKEDYVKTGSCWREGEMDMEVDLCNDDVKNVRDSKEMCGALDMFVDCCGRAAETLCGAEAKKVMHNLATTYVSLSRGAVCTTTQSPSTTSRTATTTTATTTTAATTTTITEAQDDASMNHTAEGKVGVSTSMTADAAIGATQTGSRTMFDCQKLLFIITCVVPFLIQTLFP
ncbi:uncharacterized protein LOC124122578 [Haliotis rufescens]|uniref:uncharacterized protein LOC124122578 n=1 Tax=Haliotis rufescens TaxID=6454 RepID=UPI00201E76E9|nr:uncharacterized protein LOC124122578 [Haliotis rufescens]